MNIKELSEPQYRLLFDVRRSLRYHDRRRAFFERLHQITAGLTILLAGSVLFEVARPGETAGWMVGLAIVSALLSAWDIVVNYSSKAGLHHDLKKRFGVLEMAMLAGGGDAETWQAHEVERLKIQQDEPPVFRALDVLCHNELMFAEGHKRDAKSAEHFGKLNKWQHATRHIFHWSNIAG